VVDTIDERRKTVSPQIDFARSTINIKLKLLNKNDSFTLVALLEAEPGRIQVVAPIKDGPPSELVEFKGRTRATAFITAFIGALVALTLITTLVTVITRPPEIKSIQIVPEQPTGSKVAKVTAQLSFPPLAGVKYAWEAEVGRLVIAEPESLAFYIGPRSGGSERIQLRVEDRWGRSASKTLEFSVAPEPRPQKEP
jgi:hypothetical protein